MFPDITPQLMPVMPDLRGRMEANFKLANITWFRIGGPAQLFFVPADEDDLAYFLTNLPRHIPVYVLGLGSNMLVRDGGIAGAVIRLTKAFFNAITVEDDYKIRAGSAVPDMKLAKVAAEAGIAGLEFLRGIPGGIGGALRMNAGAHGGETKDVLIEARALDRDGKLHILKNVDFGFTYRHSTAPADLIYTQALFQGRAGYIAQINADMEKITAAREASQPIRERTGGSTFKNPDGHKSWQLIDAAGCRGLTIGDAQMSEMHCNFLINRGNATAADIETLGETVRRRVLANSGVTLEWEIKRIGLA